MVDYVAYVSLGVSFILCVVFIMNKSDFTLMSINISITQGLLFMQQNEKRMIEAYVISTHILEAIFCQWLYLNVVRTSEGYSWKWHYPDSSGCNLLPRKGTQMHLCFLSINYHQLSTASVQIRARVCIYLYMYISILTTCWHHTFFKLSCWNNPSIEMPGRYVKMFAFPCLK